MDPLSAPHMIRTSAEVLGAKLLKDIEREECTLESLLKDLRTQHQTPQSKTGIPQLDCLLPTNAKTTSISGRNLPLLYHLLFHQVRVLHGTVVLLDLTSTFSPSHLISLSVSSTSSTTTSTTTEPPYRLHLSELQHIHVFPCNKSNLATTLQSLENYMLYDEGSKASRDREWVATLVLGGQGGDFSFGWRGWLRVEKGVGDVGREGFGAAVSVEEAVTESKRRMDSVGDEGSHGREWKVVCEAGSYSWKDG